MLATASLLNTKSTESKKMVATNKIDDSLCIQIAEWKKWQ
jgi:hypothetical protein